MAGKSRMTIAGSALVLGLVATTQVGCNSDVSAAPSAPTPASAPAQATLTISGSPPTNVVAGSSYHFMPQVSSSTNATLVFSINNKPDWAAFDSATGALSGTPAATSTYAAIGISVNAGTANASLPPFTITVTALTSGTATISWVPPTQNADGTPLIDLAEFRVYSGNSSGSLTQSVTVKSTATSYTMTGLSSGQWYFSVAAVNSAGVEGDHTTLVSKTI